MKMRVVDFDEQLDTPEPFRHIFKSFYLQESFPATSIIKLLE